MSNPLNRPEWCDLCGSAHGPLDACAEVDDDLCADCRTRTAEYGSDVCRECGIERAQEVNALEDWER